MPFPKDLAALAEKTLEGVTDQGTKTRTLALALPAPTDGERHALEVGGGLVAGRSPAVSGNLSGDGCDRRRSVRRRALRAAAHEITIEIRDLQIVVLGMFPYAPY
ncbi:hypothetical protein ACFXA3_12230 [Streptomyces sp. NPDC059456]|uniref:hypothetical protein n=1 Tax=Streptomyces sp. NPDC059456 TaxID=3346838 RepID=UPI0036AAD7C3